MTDGAGDTRESTRPGDPLPHADGRVLVSGAPAGATRVAVIALHGRGATAQGVRNLFEPVYRRGVTFYAPAASRNRWFPRAFDVPIAANEPHLTGAVEAVDRALEKARAAGTPAERTVLVGFSQGACVAAEFALRRPRRYGGVFVCSGDLPGETVAGERLDERVENRSPAGDLGGTPVRFGGHEGDRAVDPERIRESARAFADRGGDVTVELVPGEAHAVTDADFDALGALVEELLADDR